MDFMSWSYCERNFIKRVEVDLPKVNSIVEVANKRLEFIGSIDVNSKNVSFVVEGFYEVIKELLSALILKDGMKSLNHQCLFSFFYGKFPDYEMEARFILRLNLLRNGLNYYGRIVELDWYNDNIDKVRKIILLLKKLIVS